MQRAFDTLRDSWMDGTVDPRCRLLLWRVPANALRLLAAFLAAQHRPGGRQTPDAFLSFCEPCLLGFTYSRALNAAAVAGQQAVDAMLRPAPPHEARAGGPAAAWPTPEVTDSPQGVMQVLESLASHHTERLRYLAVLLQPGDCKAGDAFEHWLDGALQPGISQRVRLVLVDTLEAPVWQPLIERLGDRAALLEPQVDMFDVACAIAAQSPGTGPSVVFRQMLADMMLLLQRGSPQEVAARAERATALASRHGWAQQVGVLQMMQAGAWLKHGDAAQAVGLYRQVRAPAATGARHSAVSPELVMQSWFGEAGCWLRVNQPGNAVSAYRQAAQHAIALPNPVLGMEGQRMVGWCLLQDGKREAARTELLEAVRLALPLQVDERRVTTLPQTLWDLLLLQDPRRCASLQAVSTAHESSTASLLQEADARARALGPRPRRESLDVIEATLEQALQRALTMARQQRATVIKGSDAFFRSIIDAGQRLLDTAWDGLPTLVPPGPTQTPDWRASPGLALLDETPPPLPTHAPAAGVLS